MGCCTRMPWANNIEKWPSGRILVVCMQRIGDVLLTTPLIRTIKQHWPNSLIDVFVVRGTEHILEANPDINAIITVSERPTWFECYRVIRKIFRAYALAICTQTGDKPVLYAFWAARHRLGMLTKGKSRWWKSRLLSEAIEFDDRDTHTVLMNLRLAERLSIAPVPKVVLAWRKEDVQVVSQLIDIRSPNLAVLHMVPKFPYKAWTQAGWLELARWLQRNGYTVVFTGGKPLEEQESVANIAAQLSDTAVNLAAQLSLSQIACLLSHSKLYVGPDTVVTHMAAAAGIPTVALFGPSNPVKWGPWPRAWDLTNPFVLQGSQRRNNVYLLQGLGACVPCLQEGCDRHRYSRSLCLERITAVGVIGAIQQLLAVPC